MMTPRLAVMVPILALIGCADVPVSAPPPIPQGSKYVAMGSSFAAGAAIGPTQAGTPDRCGRTTNNYASLLAAKLGLTLDDESCGGAKSEHILGAWNELPAQIDAVDASTRLVTVTIGGNDLNYVGNLFMSSCTPGEVVTAGEYRITCVAPAAPPEEDYRKLERSMTAIAREVRERAPDATLIFVQYVSLVPDKPCGAAQLSAPEAEMNRTIGRRLAAITKRVAHVTGASLLESDTLSRSHTACDAVPWSNGMRIPIDLANGAPWHPNAAGHRAIADALTHVIQRAPFP